MTQLFDVFYHCIFEIEWPSECAMLYLRVKDTTRNLDLTICPKLNNKWILLTVPGLSPLCKVAEGVPKAVKLLKCSLRQLGCHRGILYGIMTVMGTRNKS